MASNDKWEVVGKGGKKRASNEGKRNKVKASDMPKADFINPLAESKTLYQALDKSKVAQCDIGNGHVKHVVPEELPAVLAERSQEHPLEIKKLVGRRIIGGKKKSAATKPQKTEQELLQEALLKVDLDELTAMLTNLESSFPNNPSIWLKDLAAYMQLKLKGVPHKDPVFEGKATDYPMCLLSTPLKTFFLDLLKGCSAPTIKLIFQHSVESMVLELSKGSSAYSDQIMIQFIVQCHPQITVANIKEILERLETCKTHAREALALMWCIGQLPHKDLAQGLKVWLEVMMPQLTVKQLMKYAVFYLENVLSTCKTASVQGVIVQPKEFFNIMDIAFLSSSPLSGNQSLQKRMLALYPKMKKLSFDAPSSGRRYFSALLNRLNSELPLEYKQEVLSCLVFCLERDEGCFDTWEDMYLTNIQQSGLLLNHILATWNTSLRVSRRKLFQLVEAVQAKNSTLLENKKNKAGLDVCIKACLAVKEKQECRSCFSLGKLFKFVLFVVLVVVAYDVYKHRSYKASKTCQILQQYGIEQAATSGYEHAKHNFNKANSWIQSNYPTYYNKFREYADPAAEFCWEKLTFTAQFVAEKTKPARDYLNQKIPELLEKIETEGPAYLEVVRDQLKHFWNQWWPVVHKYFLIVWNFLSKNVPVLLARVQELLLTLAHKIYELAPDFFTMVGSWCARLGEKIIEKLPDVLAVIQEYAIIAVNMAVNLVNSVVEWLQSIAGSAGNEDVAQQKPGGASVH